MKKFKVTVNGQAYEVEVEEIGAPAKTVSSVPAVNTQPAPAAAVKEAPKPVEVKPVPAAVTAVHATAASLPKGPVPEHAVTVKAPMPGKISFVKAAIGQGVSRGDVLVVLEAMKMQNDITASSDGTVIDVRVKVGDNVKTGDVLAVIS
ncbi:biotin/lipoyl-containing protein [Megasphaera sueciensis]|jgi:glutaconyl-CoA decarboxylase|uniref:biotin/lipoyl-containing protein n=1 Tax=Megasphaera sueciensis TaxID=349094 RepID=UPI003CFE5FBA|nr:biotin/lipoyl-binding protein [Megasphaera sp.]